jgi:hypothetical protein
MKKSNQLFSLTFAGLVLMFGSVTDAQFSDHYAPGNWNTAPGSVGSIDWSGAPGTLIVNGGDNGTGDIGFIDITIASNVTGTISFNWSYSSLDSRMLDEALYVNNSVYFPLSSTSGSSGFVSFAVNVGDVIGFSVETDDNLGGRGELTITNFSAVPESSSMALTGIVCTLTGFRRRRVK